MAKNITYVFNRNIRDIKMLLAKNDYTFTVSQINENEYRIFAGDSFGMGIYKPMRFNNNINTYVSLQSIDESNTAVVLRNPVRRDMLIIVIAGILCMLFLFLSKEWVGGVIAIAAVSLSIFWFNLLYRGQEDILNKQFINMLANEPV